MAFPFDQQSATPKEYIFCLGQTDASYDIICNVEPMEWNECVLEVSRDIEVGGMTSMFNVESLTFIGNGAAYLKNLFDSYEINANCYLFVYRFDFDTRTYISFPGVFQAKFATYKIKKIGDFAFGVNISFLRTGNYQKLVDRKTIKLDLTKNKTVGGMTLAPINDLDFISKIKIPALNSTLNCQLSDAGLLPDNPLYSLYALVEGYNSVPFSLIVSDFTEPQRVLFEYGQSAISDLTPCFHNATEQRNLFFRYDVYINVDNDFGLFGGADAISLKYAIDHEGVITEHDTTSPDIGHDEGLQLMSGTFNVTLETGDDLYFYLVHSGENGLAHVCKPSSTGFATKLAITQAIVNTSEVVVDGLPLYEAVKKALQMILDSNDPVYSEFLTAVDSTRYAHILSGLNVRGLTIQDEQGKINISFEELFHSISSMYNLGYGFETIAGIEKMRLEDYGYFFDSDNGLDLSTRITELDIEKEYMSNLAKIQVNAGYDNEVFKSVNGRGEYNTKQTRTLEISSDQELDLVSMIGAATMNIVNCLEKPVTLYGSEDIDEDEKVFILKSQLDAAGGEINKWKVETNELITIENDSSLFGDGSLNLYFSPLRNLIRNSDKITSAMTKQLSAVLRFQTSGKLSNLETSGEGYVFNVKENADITINDLITIKSPKFKPIKLILTTPFYFSDIDYLYTSVDGKLNLYRKVVLPSGKYAYIMNIKFKVGEEKATIELIEAI